MNYTDLITVYDVHNSLILCQFRKLIKVFDFVDYLGRKLSDSGMTFMNTIIDAVPKVSIITKIEVFNSILP
jgi:hypothetical protein